MLYDTRTDESLAGEPVEFYTGMDAVPDVRPGPGLVFAARHTLRGSDAWSEGGAVKKKWHTWAHSSLQVVDLGTRLMLVGETALVTSTWKYSYKARAQVPEVGRMDRRGLGPWLGWAGCMDGGYGTLQECREPALA